MYRISLFSSRRKRLLWAQAGLALLSLGITLFVYFVASCATDVALERRKEFSKACDEGQISVCVKLGAEY